MLRHCLPTLFVAAAASVVSAQSLQLDVSLEYDSFVLNEAVTLSLAVTPLGVAPFIVDDYGDYTQNTLSVILRHEAEGFIDPVRTDPPFGTLMAQAGKPEKVSCKLNDWFPLFRQGRYTVQVVARRGNESIASPLVTFQIVKGLEISSTVRMLPGQENLARRYTLLYWPRQQREELFLRIEEVPDDNAIALFRLGRVMRVEPPRLEFGANGRVTVVHQIARDRFVRTVLRSDTDNLDVVEQKQLVDPNQSTLARSILETRARERDNAPAEGEFRRRERESPAP